MTDQDEGKAALEAAAYMAAKTAADYFGDRLPEAFDMTLSAEIAEAAVRAYLQALPGWRLVPVVPEEKGFAEGVNALIRVGLDGPDGVGHSDVAVCFTAVLRVAPPPPGLEPDSHE